MEKYFGKKNVIEQGHQGEHIHDNKKGPGIDMKPVSTSGIQGKKGYKDDVHNGPGVKKGESK